MTLHLDANGGNGKFSETSCPSPFRPLMVSKDDPSLMGVVTMPCRRWTCAECFARMIDERLQHYLAVIGARPVLWCGQVTLIRWTATLRSFHRKSGGYVWVDGGDSLQVVAERRFKSAVPLVSAEAAELFSGHVAKLRPRDRSRPREMSIGSSHEWRYREEDGISRWEHLGVVRKIDLAEVLAGRGIAVRQVGAALFWKVPPTFSAAQVAGLKEEMARLKSVK
jgi:hypothetical protein